MQAVQMRRLNDFVLQLVRGLRPLLLESSRNPLFNTFFDHRSEQQVKINWLFKIDNRRKKLNSKYALVNDLNLKFAKYL